MAEPASPQSLSSSTGLTPEVELEQLKEKFAAWKAKAKVGVDQLRAQVLDLQRTVTTQTNLAAQAEARCQELQTALDHANAEVSVWQSRATAKAATPPPPAVAPRRTPTPTAVVVDTASLETIAALEDEVAQLRTALAETSDTSVARELEIVTLTTKCTLLTNAWHDAMKTAGVVAHQGTRLALAVAAAERAESNKETDKVKAEFEKFKLRSSKSLQLATQRAEDLAAKLDASEQAASRATDLNSVLATKDRIIATVEGRLQEAHSQLSQLSLQRDVLEEELRDARSSAASSYYNGTQRRSASRRDYHDDDEQGAGSSDSVREAVQAAEAAAELRLREELEALGAAHRDETEQLQLQIAQLNAKLAAQVVKQQQQSASRFGSWFSSAASAVDTDSPSGGASDGADRSDDDAYVQVLRGQLEQARNSADELRLERDQLASQVRRLHGKIEVLTRAAAPTPGLPRGATLGPSTAATDATIVALADCSPDELRRHLAVKSEQLWDANQQVLQLRAALKTATSQQLTGRSGVGGSDGNESQQQQQQRYLRSVLVNFLTAKSDDVRAGLIPVFATLLRLTGDELKATFTANPDWIS